MIFYNGAPFSETQFRAEFNGIFEQTMQIPIYSEQKLENVQTIKNMTSMTNVAFLKKVS